MINIAYVNRMIDEKLAQRDDLSEGSREALRKAAVRDAVRLLGNLVHYQSGRNFENNDVVTAATALLGITRLQKL